MIMRRYLRGCGIHRTPRDNSGGRLGFYGNGHPGPGWSIPSGCEMRCGILCHIR